MNDDEERVRRMIDNGSIMTYSKDQIQVWHDAAMSTGKYSLADDLKKCLEQARCK